MQTSSIAGIFLLLLVPFIYYTTFVPPRQLRHLPRVPILPLILSYLTSETEDNRIKRLILPFSIDSGEDIVLVWVLGRWMIHILDLKLAREMCDNTTRYPKETPDDASLLWRFVGWNSLLMSNGEQWQKQSVLINDAFTARIPTEKFVELSRNIFSIIGGSRTVRWDDLAQRFALDAVGSTILGHDFKAIETDNPFVKEYNGVMHGIANPLYMIFPWLERAVPRKALIHRIDSIVAKFMDLLSAKKDNPGDDMMSFMLKDPAMSTQELRDNMIVLFIGGHDTAAGAISTLFYFLACYPAIQERARREVLEVLGGDPDPSVDMLSGTSLPFLTACIREALRINTPISYIVPRKSAEDTTLGRYAIPAGSSLIVNIYAIHHKASAWATQDDFKPERFLNGGWKQSGWLPFALGPRQCPARNFAMYEQRTLAAMMLREYSWTLPKGSIHDKGIKNAFSPFALTLPYDLDISFSQYRK